MVFIAALRHLIDMVFGDAKSAVPEAPTTRTSVLLVACIVGLLLFLGVWMPSWLGEAIGRAADAMGTQS